MQFINQEHSVDESGQYDDWIIFFFVKNPLFVVEREGERERHTHRKGGDTNSEGHETIVVFCGKQSFTHRISVYFPVYIRYTR